MILSAVWVVAEQDASQASIGSYLQLGRWTYTGDRHVSTATRPTLAGMTLAPMQPLVKTPY